jgi:hypothetical protein
MQCDHYDLMGRTGQTDMARDGRRKGRGAVPVVRGLGSVVVLLCCLLSTGCTPPNVSITAVFLDDGHPTAIFHPCGGGVYSVSVVEKLTAPAISSATASSFVPVMGPDVNHAWGVADPAGVHTVAQLRLLDTPPGWVLQTTKPGYLLTDFVADGTYDVWADTTKPTAGRDAAVRFSLGDLRSLADGQVWAAPKPFAAPQAMTRSEFGQHAAASC